MGDDASRLTDLLAKSWEGEVIGEAFFAALTRALPDDRPAWEALTQLEATTRRLIEPVARAHGVEIDEVTAARTGEDFAAGASIDSRNGLLEATVGLATGEFVPLYRKLASLLAPEESWLGDELVAHELALVHCCEALLEGKPDGETPIVEFVARHASSS